MQINTLGKYKIRTFVKQQGEHYKNAYSLYDEIDYSIEVVVQSLLSYTDGLTSSKQYEEKLDLILAYFSQIQQGQLDFDRKTFLLTAVFSLGENIFSYLHNQGYKSISIYSDTFFGACLAIAARLSGFQTKMLISSAPQQYTVHLPSANTLISFLDYSATKELDATEAIIVTENYSMDIQQKLATTTRAKMIYWDKLALECFTHKLIVEPLKAIQAKNPGVHMIVCNNPGASFVANLSEHEKNIDTFLASIKASSETVPLTDPVFGKNGLTLAYVKEVTEGFSLYYDKNNITHYKDRQGKYVNIVGGQRVTTDLPNVYKGVIYLFGSSVCLGMGTDDASTIASCLQRVLNRNGIQYAVQNCSNYSASDDERQMALMQSMQFNPNDIIVSMLRTKERIDAVKGIFPFCDVLPAFNRPHQMGEVFMDQSHINFIGSQRMAETLYHFMQANKLFEIKEGTKVDASALPTVSSNYDLADNELLELSAYIKELRTAAEVNKTQIGAIVVNCNPFTLGHRYLIEKAASEVAHLYLFVVEEDKSMFPFKDRIFLVKEGVKDLKNVTVFPSGKFIISTRTFAAYSNKDQLQENQIDASMDVQIFAETIAPALGITIRFAGEEPLCKVTRQYNLAMQRILPKYHIDFKIIPRKASGGAPISASRVRKLLAEGNFEEIATIVPPTTLAYLKKFC
ncbi:MAG: hypothetical protein ACRDDX_11945 [Cellulosilyticaceae bacterium]